MKYRLFAEFDFIPPDKRSKVYNPVPEWLVDAEEVEDFVNRMSGKMKPRPSTPPCLSAAQKKANVSISRTLVAASFQRNSDLWTGKEEPATPIAEIRDLGWMLYDHDYTDPTDPKPLFFRAKMDHGVIVIPDCNNREEVRG